MKINIFTPPSFTKKPLNMDTITDKKWIYSSSGKASIYHILKELNIKKILVSIYICDSVLLPLKRLHIEPIFYDIEIEDLNPSLDSIVDLAMRYNIKTVLVASMYGNPANMVEIEEFCRDNDIFMIDDSAQSFGAKLEDRYIGTFGDAGFFSFSTGKPTAGHLGSFFWSKREIKIERKKHCLVHYFRWLDFYYSRYKIYDSSFRFFKKIINLISRIQMKFIDIVDDDICEFEKEILGGILDANLNSGFSFREMYYREFFNNFKNNRYFRVVDALYGSSNRHKFILVFITKEMADRFISYLRDFSIYCSNGYKLLSSNLKELPNAKKLNRRVVEIPIEDDKDKMKYLFKKVKKFEYKNTKR